MSFPKLDVEKTYDSAKRVLKIPNKLLLTAGPTNCSPRSIAALTLPSLTPICKELHQMMDDIKEMLRYVFQTKNEVTLAVQTSGTGGVETIVTNLVDPGEKVLVAIGGVWGHRTVEKAKARGADVVSITAEPGKVFTNEELEQAIIKHKPVLLLVTHGESSTGTCQPLEGLGDICHKYNCMLAVDAVVSLGAEPFFMDRWGVDAVVSATQKAISAPPGISFLSFSPQAVERMKSIKTPPPFYFNILNLCGVWGCLGLPRKYYYTFNSHMIASARAGLEEIVEEGLENVWERHRKMSERFWIAAEKRGWKPYVENAEHRLSAINIFYTPPKVKWATLVDYAMEKYQTVIGFGIGPTLNIAIRVGIMGCNATPEVVDRVVDILDDGFRFCLTEEGQNGPSTRSEVI